MAIRPSPTEARVAFWMKWSGGPIVARSPVVGFRKRDFDHAGGGSQFGLRLSMNACTPSWAAPSIMLHAIVCPAS